MSTIDGAHPKTNCTVASGDSAEAATNTKLQAENPLFSDLTFEDL